MAVGGYAPRFLMSDQRFPKPTQRFGDAFEQEEGRALRLPTNHSAVAGIRICGRTDFTLTTGKTRLEFAWLVPTARVRQRLLKLVYKRLAQYG
jgi:hypothetical protein